MLFGHIFKNCSVGGDTDCYLEEYGYGYAETRYPCGAKAPARPNDHDAYRRVSTRCGYVTEAGYIDTGAYCMEHEVCHTWLWERLGHPYSTVVHASAHGIQLPLGAIPAEERVVQWFQTYANGGERRDDKLQAIYSAGLDLDALVDEWQGFVADVFGKWGWWRERQLPEPGVAG